MYTFTYGFEKNAIDHGAAQAQLTVRVRVRDMYGQLSDPVELVCTNSSPGDVSSIRAVGMFRAIILSWEFPPDTDLAGVEIYRSQTNVFSTAEHVKSCFGNLYADEGLDINTSYYYWLVAKDVFGQVSRTPNPTDVCDVSASTRLIQDGDIEQLSVGKLIADEVFAANMVIGSGGSIQSENYNELAATGWQISDTGVNLFSGELWIGSRFNERLVISSVLERMTAFNKRGVPFLYLNLLTEALRIGYPGGPAFQVRVDDETGLIAIDGGVIVPGSLPVDALPVHPIAMGFLNSDEIRVGVGTPGVDFTGLILADTVNNAYTLGTFFSGRMKSGFLKESGDFLSLNPDSTYAAQARLGSGKLAFFGNYWFDGNGCIEWNTSDDAGRVQTVYLDARDYAVTLHARDYHYSPSYNVWGDDGTQGTLSGPGVAVMRRIGDEWVKAGLAVSTNGVAALQLGSASINWDSEHSRLCVSEGANTYYLIPEG